MEALDPLFNVEIKEKSYYEAQTQIKSGINSMKRRLFKGNLRFHETNILSCESLWIKAFVIKIDNNFQFMMKSNVLSM